MSNPIRWPAEAIWQAIDPLLPGFSVEILPEIDSTNTELMRRARQGRHDPVLLVAERQTAGRGRLGRPWHSGASQAGVLPALTFSLGLPLAPRDWSGLSLAVGSCAAEQLQPQLPPPDSGAPRLLLKWPNDLWLHDGRKLGGILLETASHGGASSRYLVVGMGINILAPAADGLSVPAAGLQDLAAHWRAEQALEQLALPLVQTLQRFAEQGFAAFAQRFAQRDLLNGRQVRLSDGQHGQACGVAADGALRVHTSAGMQHISSSEVSVRPTS